MSDLIDRQAAIDALAEWHDEAITNRLNNLPPAQPERKKGKWLPDNNNYYEERFICSVCGKAIRWILAWVNRYGISVLTAGQGLTERTVTMAEYPQREYIVRETEYPLGYTKEEEVCELVRCKDCLHNRACGIQYHAQAGDLFFCGAAERKDGDHHD